MKFMVKCSQFDQGVLGTTESDLGFFAEVTGFPIKILDVFHDLDLEFLGLLDEVQIVILVNSEVEIEVFGHLSFL
jgi:hypothetical protein